MCAAAFQGRLMSTSPHETWDRLQELVTIPSDPTGTILEFYAELKVGKWSAIDYYASRLTKPILDALEDHPARDGTWLITAPPMAAVPAAANLLSKQVCQLLAALRPNAKFHAFNLRKEPLGPLFLENHYGSSDYDGRSRYLRQTTSGWHTEPRLTNSSVIFVNDVYVTGAQEACQRAFFAASGVTNIHWHYILSVTASDHKAAAMIEAPLNYCGLARDEDFIAMLSSAHFTVTSKCLWRLLNLNDYSFQCAVAAMPSHQCRHIISLLAAERVPLTSRISDRISALSAILETRHDQQGGTV